MPPVSPVDYSIPVQGTGTFWRNPSDQLVRVYLIPVSQLSHLDIANIKVDSQVRCHLKDISKLNSNVQKYFINTECFNSYQCNCQCHYHITNKIIQLPIYFINPRKNEIFWPIVSALHYPSSVNLGTIQIFGDVFCSHKILFFLYDNKCCV